VIHNLINSISNEVNIDQRSDEEINCKEKSDQVSNKEEFSLENMKFWEVWTTKKPNFESPFWPQPPAIWGKTRMGQKSKVEESKPMRPAQSSPVEDSSGLNNDLHKAPIVTNLDNIVNMLRPVVSHSKRSEVKRDLFEKKDYQNFGNVWLESVSPEVNGEVKQSQNYPLNYKNFYDSESETFDDSNNNKMIEKRNLKKIVIEQKDNNNFDEVVYKKKKKKPTIVIEEEYVDPTDDELYKILKNNESPASKQVIIEEDDEEEQEIPKKKPLVTYEKKEKLKVKRKPRKMVIIEKDELLDDNSDDDHNDSEDESKQIPKTIIKPINERRKYKKTLRAEASDEIPKKDVLNEKFDSFHDSSSYYYNENDENSFGDEKAWGSASPHTRVKAGTNTKRLLNPFSVLQRLRPKRRPFERQPNRMIPGGTFRMRFYMNGQQREEEQNDDYDY
jgi:hypothetical protein